MGDHKLTYTIGGITMPIFPFVACFFVLFVVNTLFLTLMFMDFGDR